MVRIILVSFFLFLNKSCMYLIYTLFFNDPDVTFDRLSTWHASLLYHKASQGKNASVFLKIYALLEVVISLGPTLTRWLHLQTCQHVPQSASLGDCIRVIQSLPIEDPPEVLGVHPEASRSYRETQGQQLLETLITMQPTVPTACLEAR